MMVHHLEDLECVLHLPQLRQTSVGKTQKIVNHGKYQTDLVGRIYVLVLVHLRFNSVWLTGLNSDLYNFVFLSSNSSLSWVDIFHIFRPVVKQVCRMWAMWVGRNSWDGCFLHRILALCRSTSSKSSTKYVLHWFFFFCSGIFCFLFWA